VPLSISDDGRWISFIENEFGQETLAKLIRGDVDVAQAHAGASASLTVVERTKPPESSRSVDGGDIFPVLVVELRRYPSRGFNCCHLLPQREDISSFSSLQKRI
jgi:hypothetical protein